MKIVSWTDDVPRYGALEGDDIRLLEGGWDAFRPTGTLIPAGSVTLRAPVNPRSIVCVGLNYRLHAEESGYPVPVIPPLFTKLTSSVVADGEPILRPAGTEKLDYEAELGVVIGTTARGVSAADALDHVAGYVCVNDVSARDLQKGDGFGWVRGKSADTFCPVGPYVVTRDEIPDPQALGIRAWVNGEPRQDSTTADMVFPVAEIIEFVSRDITLVPGDLLCTGTPSGVADGMADPRYLRGGDIVVVEIDGLGRLRNTVSDADRVR